MVTRTAEPDSSDLLTDLRLGHVTALTAALSGAAAALSTGFSKLDLLTGGLSGTVAVASAPGGGKTSLAANWITAWAAAETAASLFASPELPQSVVLNRLCANVTGVALSEFRTGRILEPKYKEKWAEWDDWVALNGKRIAVRGRGEALDFLALKARAQALQDATGGRVVVVADGLQTLADRFRRPGESDKDALDRTMGEWVDGWGSLDVMSVVLSHMPKGSFDSSAQGVFAGSSRIEYRADTAIVLQPDGDRSTSTTYPVNLTVTKSWHGPVGRVRLRFDGACCRFKDSK
jgi:replicative DNA helicase